MGKSVWEISSSSDDRKFSRDSSLFSSSLQIIPNEKLNANNHDLGQSDLFDIVENLLPDNEDDLFAGIIDGFDVGGSTRYVDHLEEYDDLFGSGGGIELESDCCSVSRLNLSDSVPNDGTIRHVTGHNCVGGTVIGEHPAGEHPSRTLFVRNINSNVEDSELIEIFQVYGDIRSLYTACKHRGFVMISYYDIRAAKTALRALQNKPLRRRKMDIHFSIPKDNPSDKDLNQGTLVIFNLDPSVLNEDLQQFFGVYGEIKEIRETPLKRHHKFIEFYDTRASEAALRALSRRDIAGECVKLEPSRPGGARRNGLHISQDQDQYEPLFLLHQMSSSFGNSPPGNWSQIGAAVEQSQLSSLGKSPDFQSSSPTMSNFGYSNALQQSLSFPDSKSIMFPRTLSSFVSSSSNGSGIDTLSGSQSIWGSPKVYSEPTNSSSLREQTFQHPLLSSTQTHGFSFSGHGPFLSPIQAQSTHHHDVGSAPSERHMNFYHYTQEAFKNRTARGFEYKPRVYENMASGLMMNMGAANSKVYENVASGFGTMHSPRVSHMFIGNGRYPRIATATNLEDFHDCGYNNGNNLDSKQQFQLDFEKIKRGEDSRTTLMIKNIPNKYNSKMLLEAIDEKFQATYDFLYLPIDFRAFNGKKWERFNSEKVASLAYARIQGKTALVAHFHNSSVMNEDKRCRPIVFQQEGTESGDQAIQEQFQVHNSNGSERTEHCGILTEDIWYE